jgi:hypothetical protein
MIIATANDTLLLDAPVVRGPAVNRTADRTSDLMRIVRHALKAPAATSPLDRAIRSAAHVSPTGGLASVDADGRARLLARRMNTLLTRRALPAADLHRETVRP